MNAWVLLIFTVICAYVTYDSFRWRDSVRRAPFSVISSMWKDGLAHLSTTQQSEVKGRATGFMGIGQFPWIFLLITIVCLTFTVYAFLG